ncbi:MAG: YunC family protein [Lentisphaeria bacterium]|nr:YunC family protein [Lentisphaeria bacterium]
MDKIKIDDIEFSGSTIEMLQGKLLLIQGRNGMLGCGYFNVETADKLNSAMAIVTGVKCYDDMLTQPVVKVSARAAEYGVTIGISGKEALLLMK